LQVLPLRNRNANILCAYTRKIVLNSHQFAGVGVRQSMQQGCVDDTVDGRGGSDAEGQREDGDGGESGGLAQHAGTIADVLPQRFDQMAGADLASLLFDLLDAAEFY